MIDIPRSDKLQRTFHVALFPYSASGVRNMLKKEREQAIMNWVEKALHLVQYGESFTSKATYGDGINISGTMTDKNGEPKTYYNYRSGNTRTLREVALSDDGTSFTYTDAFTMFDIDITQYVSQLQLENYALASELALDDTTLHITDDKLYATLSYNGMLSLNSYQYKTTIVVLFEIDMDTNSATFVANTFETVSSSATDYPETTSYVFNLYDKLLWIENMTGQYSSSNYKRYAIIDPVTREVLYSDTSTFGSSIRGTYCVNGDWFLSYYDVSDRTCQLFIQDDYSVKMSNSTVVNNNDKYIRIGNYSFAYKYEDKKVGLLVSQNEISADAYVDSTNASYIYRYKDKFVVSTYVSSSVGYRVTLYDVK